MSVEKGVVLVVDDEEDLRDAIVYDFKKKGYQVLQASNGKEAFDIVMAQKVDLVISDVRMPISDGIELLKNLRAKDQKSPPLIFISGYTEVSEVEIASLGAAAIFPKPFDRKELFSTVEKVLAQSVS